MKIHCYYELTNKWFKEMATKSNFTISNEKIIYLPEQIGKGFLYFTKVTPWLSIFCVNANFSTKIEINRVSSDDDLYILQYDLSKSTNKIKIGNTYYKTSYNQNLGFRILDSKIPNIFFPSKNNDTFILRIIIDKKKVLEIINEKLKNTNQPNTIKLIEDNYISRYDKIDSDTIILLNEVKYRKEIDTAFDFYLKGISIKLFSNFINKYFLNKPNSLRFKEPEIDSINETVNYLMSNLYNPFPGVKFLADIAGISLSKYKTIFKIIHSLPPKKFFIKEQMLLANLLLKSKKYSTIKEVISELGYNNLSAFDNNYYTIFNRLPYEDFMNKNT